ncbi:MAG TPA: cytochrome c oxidase subunit 4 [Acidimicrobiales bacterium]|nr:cytochrome c oxidase subunit 4 [Acidimicrobiales bacterium]
MSVGARMLLAIGAFLVVVTAVYWFFSYEEAGSVLLLLSAGLALIVGGYLWWATRARPTATSTAQGHGDEEAEHYLPHASIWPFGVGAGSVVLANGLALGLWAAVPGSMLLVASVIGYARQSRHRD